MHPISKLVAVTASHQNLRAGFGFGSIQSNGGNSSSENNTQRTDLTWIKRINGFTTVSKNVSKGVGKVLGRVVVV